MMVVRKDQNGRHVVGHYNPKTNEFETLSVGKAFDDAIQLANYINGGTGQRLWNRTGESE